MPTRNAAGEDLDPDAVMDEADKNKKRSSDQQLPLGGPALPTGQKPLLALPPSTSNPESPSSKKEQKRLRTNTDKNIEKKGSAPINPNDAKSGTSRGEDRRAQ